jgi:hypothetical protein
MKLRNLFARRIDPPASSQALPQERAVSGGDAARESPLSTDSALDNVVPLRNATAAPVDAAQTDAAGNWPPPIERSPAPAFPGLLETREVASFLGRGHGMSGFRYGTRRQSQQALELEVDVLTAEFQNVLRAVIAQRHAKRDKALQYKAETGGGSTTITERLDITVAALGRDIQALEEQVELAGQRKGWVLQAINEFRLGFDQGVRAHLDFHQLLG